MRSARAQAKDAPLIERDAANEKPMSKRSKADKLDPLASLQQLVNKRFATTSLAQGGRHPGRTS